MMLKSIIAYRLAIIYDYSVGERRCVECDVGIIIIFYA